MKRRWLAIVQSGVLLSAVLAAGCGHDNFPVTPTPIATSPIVLQATRYQGTLVQASGATTSFNMTLIARGLSGATRPGLAIQAAGPLSVTGSFETGNGLSGTVQGTLTGSLDAGFFQGSLIASAASHTDEQRSSGPITNTSAALAPGDCIQGSCAADGLTGAVQATQTTTGAPPPPACSYTIAPTSASFAATGGTGTTTVTTASNCTWPALSSVPWITIVGAATGNGAGTVTYAVQANPGEQRSGSLQIAGQTVNITQSSGTCSYTLIPATQSVQAAGGSFSTAVTTTCAWTASSDVPWITINAGGSGTTSGTLTYAVASTSDTSTRTGHLTVQGAGGSATLTVTQAGTVCSYTLNPTTQSVPSGGGSFSTALTTSCAWTASSDVPWITISAGASGTTSGTITYATQSNSGAARTGHITVTGAGGSATLTVTQSGPPTCTYTLNPSTQSVATAGGSFSTGLTTTCAWTATSDVAWITITAGASGSTSGTITYSAAANTGAARTGRITVTGAGGSATLTVSQSAPSTCTYALNPSTQSVPTAGGSSSTALTTTCAWTATSDVPWITITAGASGSTSGTITYSAAANTGAARTGHITVAGAGGSAMLTVTQAAACTYMLNPSAQSVPFGGGSFSTALTTSCGWTVASDVPWITITSGASGSASGTISYLVAQGVLGPARTGHITVTGAGGTAVLTLTQDPGCAYSFSPSTQSVGPAGGSFSYQLVVTGGPGCTPWTAVSDVPWIAITAGGSGTMSGTVTYTVQPNVGPARSGRIITLNFLTFTVNQVSGVIGVVPGDSRVVPRSLSSDRRN